MNKLFYILVFSLLSLSGIGQAEYYSSWEVGGIAGPTIPDSTFVEAEHMTFIFGSFPAFASYYSNDTSAVMNTGSRGVEYTLANPVDSLSFTARIDRAGIGVKIVVNGVDSVAVDNIPYLNIPGADKMQDVGVSIELDAGDVIQIIRTAQYINLDYVIFYYNYGGEVVAAPDPTDTVDYYATYAIEENWYANTYLGSTGGTYPLFSGYGDNMWFRTSNDSLFSMMPFDYEMKKDYTVEIDTGDGIHYIKVDIENLTGKWDANGIADAELAAKYYDLDSGDCVLFNATNAIGDIYLDDPIFFDGMTYENKLKQMGGHKKGIRYNLDSVHGFDSANPFIITNWLGQLKVQDNITIKNGDRVLLTGEYDSLRGTGNVSYNPKFGHAYQAGKFGIEVNNYWTPLSLHGISIIGQFTDVGLSHIQVGNGLYDGINTKDDNAVGLANNIYYRYIFALLNRNEPHYTGNNKSGEKQVIRYLKIYNFLSLLNGGDMSYNRLSFGSVVKNYVNWTGLCWLNPFQNFQDKALNLNVIQGGILFKNGIDMGPGENFGQIAVKFEQIEDTWNELPVVMDNLYYWKSRGQNAFYLGGAGGDTSIPFVFKNLLVSDVGYDYDRVNTSADTTGGLVFHLNNFTTPFTFQDITFDKSLASISANQENVTLLGTNERVDSIAIPEFVDPMGEYELDPLISFWTGIIWESTNCVSCMKKGDTAVYKVGEQVVHNVPVDHTFIEGARDARFYIAIVENSLIEPGVTPGWETYWELMYDETTNFRPPLDFRNKPGSINDSLGMGLDVAVE